MTAALTPNPKVQFFAADGTPLVGGKLYSYAAGTTTPLATYINYAGVTANTNPVILDSRGEANVWLDNVLYKLALYDANDALIWTVDNVSAVNTGIFNGPVQGTTGTFSGALTALSGAFSGPVSGTTGAFSGAVSATGFTGSGLALTALNASNLSSGTIPDARFPATLPAGVTVPAAQLSGAIPSAITATTQAIGTNSTLVATTAYADRAALTGATYQTLTGSRALGTTYTNSTGRFIVCHVSCNASSSTNLTPTIGGIAMQGIVITTGQNGGMQFVVPPGATYSVASTSLTLNNWYELRT